MVESPVRRAVIDIGTNSVKLLVAEVAGTLVRPLWERGKQTRLGQGFYETHILRAEPMAATARAVAKFMRKAVEHGVLRSNIRIIATSAARDALNQTDLLNAVRLAGGIPPEVISGQQEAAWAYLGVTTTPEYAGRRVLIMEVGGGSMQLILGEGGGPRFNQSYKLGVVRLLEQFKPGDPPSPADLERCRGWLREFCRAEIEPALSAAIRDEGGARSMFVGSGGTAAVLARMERRSGDLDRAVIESVRLPLAAVSRWVEVLWSRGLAERQLIPGLPKNRADVMLMGPVIYEAVMQCFGFTEMRVSTRGLRFGVLASMAAQPKIAEA